MDICCAMIKVAKPICYVLSAFLLFSCNVKQWATAVSAADLRLSVFVGALELRKNWGSHIDASHSRQPLVKGERLVRHEVNAVMTRPFTSCSCMCSDQFENTTLASELERCASYPKGYAAPDKVPCQCNMWRSPSKLKRSLPQPKIHVTSKSPVGNISVVTLIRTDTTLDHSQKAEKV